MTAPLLTVEAVEWLARRAVSHNEDDNVTLDAGDVESLCRAALVLAVMERDGVRVGPYEHQPELWLAYRAKPEPSSVAAPTLVEAVEAVEKLSP